MGMDVVRVHKVNLGRCLQKKMASRILKIYSDFKSNKLSRFEETFCVL